MCRGETTTIWTWKWISDKQGMKTHKRNHRFTALSSFHRLAGSHFHRIRKQVSSNMHGTLAITCGK